MKRVSKYFYYRIYKYYSNGDVNPFFSTFCLIIIFLFINILALADLVSTFLDLRIVNLPSFKGGTLAYFWPLLFLIPGYFIFNHLVKESGVHNSIMEEFKDETVKQKRISMFFVFLYFFCSILFFVLALWLRQILRGY